MLFSQMLRLISNGNGNGPLKATGFVRFISFKSWEQRTPSREKLTVRLCGQIDGSPDMLNNGTIIIPMVTKNVQNDFYAKHRVFVPSSILKNHSANQMNRGQRVYVTGYIGYKELRNDDNYPEKTAQINANKILLCGQNEDVTSDVNDVKLYGHVNLKPHLKDNITMLEVATQTYDSREQNYKKNLHQVMVMEDDEIQQRAIRLDIGAGVYIHGCLKTEHVRKQNAILRLMYYIRPSKLIVCQPTKDNFEFEEY